MKVKIVQMTRFLLILILALSFIHINQATSKAAETTVMDDESFQAQMSADWNEIVQDRTIKEQIIKNEIIRLEIEIESTSSLKKIIQNLALVVPFNLSIRELGEFSVFNSGERLLEKRARLLDLPLKDFKSEFKSHLEFLENPGLTFGNNLILNKRALESLLYFGSQDVLSHTVWSFLNLLWLLILSILIYKILLKKYSLNKKYLISRLSQNKKALISYSVLALSGAIVFTAIGLFSSGYTDWFLFIFHTGSGHYWSIAGAILFCCTYLFYNVNKKND